MAYRLTSAAEDQINALLLDSARGYGLHAAGRYGELILTVMAALGEASHLTGSVEVPRFPNVYAYPIHLGRRRVEPSRRVGNPRHLIVYRLGADDVVEILGVVHDRMVLSRAARRMLRTTSND